MWMYLSQRNPILNEHTRKIYFCAYSQSHRFISFSPPTFRANELEKERQREMEETKRNAYKIVNVLPKVHSPDERWQKRIKF